MPANAMLCVSERKQQKNFFKTNLVMQNSKKQKILSCYYRQQTKM